MCKDSIVLVLLTLTIQYTFIVMVPKRIMLVLKTNLSFLLVPISECVVIIGDSKIYSTCFTSLKRHYTSLLCDHGSNLHEIFGPGYWRFLQVKKQSLCGLSNRKIQDSANPNREVEILLQKCEDVYILNDLL